MMGSDILLKGVERGIITSEQARQLRALGDVRDPDKLLPSPDDEQLRFIGGFNDIFVTIGFALFLGAIGYFGSQFGGNLGNWIAVGATAWLLAEFFTRIRRMALPSIVLLIVFAWAAFAGAATMLGAYATPYIFPPIIEHGINGKQPAMLATAAFLTVLVTALHYLRFQVPITIAAGCGALSLAVIGLIYAGYPELSLGTFRALILACGLAIFALAMRFDLADPERKTLRTDIAFWLHLLAAPLIVHSVIGQMVTAPSKLPPGTAVMIIAVFLVFQLYGHTDRSPRNAGVRPCVCRGCVRSPDPASGPFGHNDSAHNSDTRSLRAVPQRRMGISPFHDAEDRTKNVGAASPAD